MNRLDFEPDRLVTVKPAHSVYGNYAGVVKERRGGVVVVGPLVSPAGNTFGASFTFWHEDLEAALWWTPAQIATLTELARAVA